MRAPWVGDATKVAVLVVLCTGALQLVFAARIACMALLAPQSSAFQRSEAWRLLGEPRQAQWGQTWVDGEQISNHLKRAVIASEDAGFTSHEGVEWEAIQSAWDRNRRAEVRAERRAQAQPGRKVQAKVVGGSTITQQLAKNLFLSGERTVLRKAQELVLSLLLEALLSKQRILEIYLNQVEWGEGVFGAQAASRHYFRVDAARLGPEQAARLAVMLPAPKRFEKNLGSAYVVARAATVLTRMGAVELP
jgi:monofunctional biosynthetic peptidoglycan transglycosylase